MRRFLAWVRRRPGVFRIFCLEHPGWPIARRIARREFVRYGAWRLGQTDTAPLLVRSATALRVPPAECDEFVLRTVGPAFPRALKREIKDLIV